MMRCRRPIGKYQIRTVCYRPPSSQCDIDTVRYVIDPSIIVFCRNFNFCLLTGLQITGDCVFMRHVLLTKFFGIRGLHLCVILRTRFENTLFKSFAVT
jgi:hypothetical protein